MALLKSTMDQWRQRPPVEEQSFVDRLPHGPRANQSFSSEEWGRMRGKAAETPGGVDASHIPKEKILDGMRRERFGGGYYEEPSEFDMYKQAMNTASGMAGVPQDQSPDWMLKAQMYADKFKDKAQGVGDNIMALKSLFTGGM